MEDNHYGDAVTNLESAAECKGNSAEGYYMARAQVSALLAIADLLDSIDTRLMHIRDAVEQHK
jgi:hypothetical protein